MSHHWKDALLPYVANPQLYSSIVKHATDDIVTILDQFPKARYHYLVLPRRRIDSILDLKRSDVSLIDKMETEAQRLCQDHPNESFRVGFHAVPSMRQLHLHVISQDFQSDCLKNKKHYNSFTTDFFLDVPYIRSTLKEEGAVEIDKLHYETLLKLPLRCFRCSELFRQLPRLKLHLQHCTKTIDDANRV